MKIMFISFLLILFSCGETVNTSVNQSLSEKETLGEALFSDQNLSLDRTMSCKSCHNPDQAFIDNRISAVNGATSLGQDGITLGDRNSPTITYAKFIPNFNQVAGDFFGGQFLDGRATDLTEQAKGPFLDAAEMQMPSKESVVLRVLENSEYVSAFNTIYGENILNNTEQAFNAIADAIAEFERSDQISPFDSKFDRSILNAQETRGLNIFRSARCVRCHDDRGTNPLFSDFSYQNIGVPENNLVRSINGKPVDQGLFQNPNVTDITKRGRFRVSSLRNIGVTAPYMHNGVFQELKTVVHFYNTRDVPGAINPETGNPWQVAEVPTGVVTQDIGNLGLSEAQEDDLVAFLRTLTDQKYE